MTAAQTVVLRLDAGVQAEEWRPWPGNAKYEISTLGRVRSWIPWRSESLPHVLRPGTRRSGHLFVILLVDGKRRSRYVHQLVLETFVGPRPRGLMCRHRDDSPANNRVSNLVWGTQSENNRDRKRNDPAYLKGERNNSARLSEADVRAIRGTPLAVTSAQLARVYGVSSSAIRKVRQGRNWAGVA